MKKKLLSLALVLTMVLSLLPTAALAAGAKYTVTVKDLEVSSSKGSEDGTATLDISLSVSVETDDDDDDDDTGSNTPGNNSSNNNNNNSNNNNNNNSNNDDDKQPDGGGDVDDKQPDSDDDDKQPNDGDDDDNAVGGQGEQSSGTNDVTPSALASQSAAIDLFAVNAGNLVTVTFMITGPENTSSSATGKFNSSENVFTCAQTVKAAGDYTVTAKVTEAEGMSDSVTIKGSKTITSDKVAVELKAASGKFSNCVWDKGYVYWAYAPADTSITVDTSKFHIKVASKTVTPSVTTATFTVGGKSVTGFKFPLEQTSAEQKVEICFDKDTSATGTCTVPAMEADTSKTIDPTNVKYDPATGALTWTMKDITASNAVVTANDEFYVEFYTKGGKSVSSTVQLMYVPSGSTAGTTATPISISGSTYSATVPQPSGLDGGASYIISVQNRNRPNKVEYTFTAVGAGKLILALPKASDVTSSNVDGVIQKLGGIGVNTLSEAMVNSTNVKNFVALSQAVGKVWDLTAVKSVATNANAVFLDNQGRIQMQGAEVNASQTGSTLKLEVGPSEKSSELLALPAENGYQNSGKVTFSMTLTQVKNTELTTLRSLSFPVLITLPVPEDISMKNVVVLHYSARGVYDKKLVTASITNSTRTITVAVTGFSDFVITENTNVDNTAVSTDAISDPKPTSPAPSGFPDVPASSTFAAPIKWAQKNGILGGYSDGTFRPNNSTTRQALWMVLARMSGVSPANMAEARNWSINSGVSDGTNPQNPLTRQQLITMLYRFAKQQGVTISGSANLSGYSDNGSVANYAREALAWGVANGIITGTNEGKLNPQGTATRAHFAAFLYRYANL